MADGKNIGEKSALKRLMDSRAAWNLMAPFYNRMVWNAVEDVVGEMLGSSEIPDNARVLDVGAGPGYATRLAAERHPASTFIGVDYSPVQVRLARKYMAARPLPNCSFEPGDAMELPFEDDSFDYVISVASIKHWPDGVRGLKEISRVLKPGCGAHIGEADRECDRRDFEEFARVFMSPWWVNRAFLGPILKDAVFGQSYSRAELERMAREAGFERVCAEKVIGKPFISLKVANP